VPGLSSAVAKGATERGFLALVILSPILALAALVFAAGLAGLTKRSDTRPLRADSAPGASGARAEANPTAEAAAAFAFDALGAADFVAVALAGAFIAGLAAVLAPPAARADDLALRVFPDFLVMLRIEMAAVARPVGSFSELIPDFVAHTL